MASSTVAPDADDHKPAGLPVPEGEVLMIAYAMDIPFNMPTVWSYLRDLQKTWARVFCDHIREYRITQPVEEAPPKGPEPVKFQEVSAKTGRLYNAVVARCLITDAEILFDISHVGPTRMNQHFRLSPKGDSTTRFEWLLTTSRNGWFGRNIIAGVTSWLYKGEEGKLWGKFRGVVIEEEAAKGNAAPAQ